MPARHLVTIGDLRASPLSRTNARRSRAVRGVEKGIGHVDAFRYHERSDMGAATSATAGGPLQDAALALLNKFDASGVTPMSQADPTVGDFQSTWNADPANAGDQLTVDSSYGPLTSGALAAIVGGVAPAVNYGGSANVIPPPGVVTPASSSTESEVLPWLLIGAAAVGAYFLFVRKRKTVHHRHTPGTAVEIKTNPRRRRSRPRRRNDMLIA